MPKETLKQGNLKTLDGPDQGKNQIIHFDTDVKGLGLRITDKGVRSFTFDFRNAAGRSKRYTIGRVGDWKLADAKKKARELAHSVDLGRDPSQEKHQLKIDAKFTIEQLCALYTVEHLKKKRSAEYCKDCMTVMKNYVFQSGPHSFNPKIVDMPVRDVKFATMTRLHAAVTELGSPYQANRTISLLRAAYNWAIKMSEGDLAYNPAAKLGEDELNDEPPRERFLSADELVRFTEALNEHHDQRMANVFRLLLLTGARRSEVTGAEWNMFDFDRQIWVKPSAHTKTKKTHTVPLSAPALAILTEMHDNRTSDTWVFPKRDASGPIKDLKNHWRQICRKAELVDLRVHDLRHSHASLLLADGHSLYTIGKALGHTQNATTERYAHLDISALRSASEGVGARVMPPAETAEIVDLKDRRNG